MRERASTIAGVVVGFVLMTALMSAAPRAADAPLAPRIIGASAQTIFTITPDKKLQWDQPTVAGVTLAQVNAMHTTIYFDPGPQGPTAGSGIAGLFGCTGAAPSFVCTLTQTMGTLLPNATGNHRVVVGVQNPNGDGTFSSEARSAECAFRFDIAPNTPANLRFVDAILPMALRALHLG